MKNYINWKVLTILIVTSIIAILYVVLNMISRPMSSTHLTLNHLKNDNPIIGGSFQLIDSNQNIFTDRDILGKPSLVYFGFTYCPDVCITSIHKINRVLDILDKYKIEANAVFITVDPKRDTPEVLYKYFRDLNPRFIALTGSQEQIRDIADKYKVYYSIAGDETKDDYLIDHSTFIYLLDKEGKYVTHFTINSKPEEIVEYIRTSCR